MCRNGFNTFLFHGRCPCLHRLDGSLRGLAALHGIDEILVLSSHTCVWIDHHGNILFGQSKWLPVFKELECLSFEGEHAGLVGFPLCFYAEDIVQSGRISDGDKD